jgi:phosphopantetheinyl transferase
MSEGERPEIEAIKNNKQKREKLRHRIVVKEAARLWWGRQHGTVYPHPCEFVVGHDELGAPRLEPANDPALPHISASHTSTISLAVASPIPIGIDVEPESRPTEEFREQYLTPGEQQRIALLEAEMPEEAWSVRYWCAKEAVGKFLGIGLEGRPKQFEVIELAPTGTLTVRHRETNLTYEVQTIRWNGWVYAYTYHSGGAQNGQLVLSEEFGNS